MIAIELALVAIDVLINQWNTRFYNALQDRNWDAFVSELLFFCVLAAAFIVIAVYQLYLNQWLQIRWRRWMTQQYLDHWLDGANHYRMQLLGDAADNPDQRIAEDIRLFIERTLYLGLGLLSAIVTLVSFVVILWRLSRRAPLQLFGTTASDPRLPGLGGADLCGRRHRAHASDRPAADRRSISHQQRFEADFRFNLVRVRENSEQIALLRGEAAETRTAARPLRPGGRQLDAIMTRTKRLTFFTAGYTQVAIVFPFIVVSPAYFAGAIQLGGLMQTASAFNSVQGALSFFVNVYRQLAEWRAVIERLDGFDARSMAARGRGDAQPAIAVAPRAGKRCASTIDDLAVHLPNGTPLVAADDLAIAAGERVLVTGPSGAASRRCSAPSPASGRSARARVVVPEGRAADDAAAAALFPGRHAGRGGRLSGRAGHFDAEAMAEALSAVGLPALAQRLDEEAHWNRMLSLGEQQRLGIARALLQAPDYPVPRRGHASLDEAAEAALYGCSDERLPRTTIVSIGHRSTLTDFHSRRSDAGAAMKSSPDASRPGWRRARGRGVRQKKRAAARREPPPR